MAFPNGELIDRELLNHPRDAKNVFRHTLTSLSDCLTIIEETGGLMEAMEYQGEDELNAIFQLMNVVKQLNFYNEEDD
tara:strand:+ start:1643 stop:1876 length:234 start_codon:yes stop_codon:yes gene_type:complete